MCVYVCVCVRHTTGGIASQGPPRRVFASAPLCILLCLHHPTWTIHGTCLIPPTPSPPTTRAHAPCGHAPRQVTTDWLTAASVSAAGIDDMGGPAFYNPANATFYFSYRMDFADFDEVADGYAGGTNVYLFTVS